MVKKEQVFTPHADYCLPGITRATVSYIYFKTNEHQFTYQLRLNLERKMGEALKILGVEIYKIYEVPEFNFLCLP